MTHHLREAHGENSRTTIKPNIVKVVKSYAHPCDLCSRKFSKKYHLTFHKKRVHGICVEKLACDVCGKTLSEKNEICSHENLIIRKLVCPVCKNDISKNEIQNHLEVSHNLNIEGESLKFETFEKFSLWKDEIEKKYCCKYLLLSTWKKNDKKYLYYRCHRSGVFTSKSTGQRTAKYSVKSGSFCPASIKVHCYCGLQCDVAFISTHFGHENDLEYVSQSKKNNGTIATGISIYKTLNRLTVIKKEKLAKIHRAIKRWHKLSLSVDSIVISKEDGWVILSSKLDETHTITENKSECQCKLICSDCNVCIHKYTCTCVDARTKKWIMCKHVHILCNYLKLLKHKNDTIEVEPEAVSSTNNETETMEQNLFDSNGQIESSFIIKSKLAFSTDTETEIIVQQLSGSSGQVQVDSSFEEDLKKVKQEYINILNATTNWEQLTILKQNLTMLRSSFLESCL